MSSEHAILTRLLESFPFLTERSGSADHAAVNVPAPQFAAFAAALRDAWHFDMLTDIAGCDWGESATPRYSAIYHFFNTASSSYLRVACDAPAADAPELPSLTGLYSSANWFEREAFDMFGIRFKGHPALSRILMWDDYPWHPLRKDFPLAGRAVPLPAVDALPGARTRIEAVPLAGGPFVASSGNTMHSREPQGQDQSWREATPKPTT